MFGEGKDALAQFWNGSVNSSTLTAAEFTKIWEYFDSDGNGFLEGEEIDQFLKQFLATVLPEDTYYTAVGKGFLSLKRSFLETFDDNGDGRIEITEMAKLLPTDENFLLLFRFSNPLESSVEFMKIWNRYDADGSGFLEANELRNFLRDLLTDASKSNEVTEDQLIEYTDMILQMFDSNKDGKLQLSEMSRLLPVKENFLERQIFKDSGTVTREDIENIFSLYDRDGSGYIENEELKGFLKDLLSLIKKEYDFSDLEDFYVTIMKGCDTNRDGKLSKKELTMVLMALVQM